MSNGQSSAKCERECVLVCFQQTLVLSHRLWGFPPLSKLRKKAPSLAGLTPHRLSSEDLEPKALRGVISDNFFSVTPIKLFDRKMLTLNNILLPTLRTQTAWATVEKPDHVEPRQKAIYSERCISRKAVFLYAIQYPLTLSSKIWDLTKLMYCLNPDYNYYCWVNKMIIY